MDAVHQINQTPHLVPITTTQLFIILGAKLAC